MESFNFELKLLSNVERTVVRDAGALSKLEAQAKKAQEAFNFEKQLSKIDQQFKRINSDPHGFKELIEKTKKLAELKKSFGHEGFLDAFTKKVGFGKLVTAAAVGDIVGDAVIEGAHKFVDIITEGVKKAFEAGAKAETLGVGERLSLGTSGSKSFREDVGRFSKLTGFDDDLLRSMLLKTRRAGMGQLAARSAFAAASDVAAGEGQGGNTGRISELLDAFTNIKLKGGVRERMLPGLGVDVKQFYSSLAKELKLDTGHAGIEAAKKRAEEGKVDPQLLLNTIYRGIEAKQGGKLGTGTIEYSKTMQARFSKIADLPEQYLKTISESPAWDKLSAKLGATLDALDPDGPRGKRIIGALLANFEKLTDWADRMLKPENIDRFVSGLEKIPSILDKVLTASEVIGTVWAGSKIVGALESVAMLLPGIATASGTAVAGVAALGAPLLAVGAAAASVGVALARIQNTAEELGGWKAVSRDLKDWVSSDGPALATDKVNENSPAWKRARYQPDLVTMPPAVASSSSPGSSASGGKVTVHAPVSFVMQVSSGEDQDKSHRDAAENLKRHISAAIEQAAQEGGG